MLLPPEFVCLDEDVGAALDFLDAWPPEGDGFALLDDEIEEFPDDLAVEEAAEVELLLELVVLVVLPQSAIFCRSSVSR